MSFLVSKLKEGLKDVEEGLKDAKDDIKSGFEHVEEGAKRVVHHHVHSHMHYPKECSDGDNHHLHRFQSFAPQREGNNAKWYVDGCSYFHAVSVALESARHEIWILDWWLSPELYLRRPPAKNEQYRLDRMLFAAAERGVQVNIIVYKEVTQALTLSSAHTKHWLEEGGGGGGNANGNIKVLRHPDHVPDAKTLASNWWANIREHGFSPAKLAALPIDAVEGIYGVGEDTILYWAHHEKLCIVDGEIAFMGGLDMCFGRWDTNQHSIADAHPDNLDNIVFPGQDYNNARIYDFQDVSHWENNKLDRKYNSRMGWSDVSISLQGPVVEDLRAHFAQRWNFIYFEKYGSDKRYHPIIFQPSRTGIIGHPYTPGTDGGEPDGNGQYEGFRKRMHEIREHGRLRLQDERKRLKEGASVGEEAHRVAEETRERIRQELHRGKQDSTLPSVPTGPYPGGMQCQIMRSCCKWSHGVPLEHSIANAYIETIRTAEHFIYIENQFFITATGDSSLKPVENQIGAAIVERILRAAQNKESFHMIVAIPALPGFAGDIQSDEALGTRAIMQFQYNAINRSKHSIMGKIAEAGVNPTEYIRFYNLRNYDRINTASPMKEVEAQAGVDYDDARRGYDERYGQAAEAQAYGAGHQDPTSNEKAYEKYQEAAADVRGGATSADSVAGCYMLGGEDIRNVPWTGDAQSEMDAFVTEELYIHTKMLIADDRKVIVGSANLNDRSQLGSHDSEIAILIEDQEEIDSFMAGKPWKAAKFAACLRRQAFRKHLGLIPPQDRTSPNANFLPVGADPNVYDWNSREDQAVTDPLAPSFLGLWNTTARNNTEAFRRVFHAIPDDTVQDWKQYDAFYDQYFKPSKANEEAKSGGEPKPNVARVGHVCTEEFSAGEQGVKEVKEVLARVKGTLVEMPLLFLKDVQDLAHEGLSYNAMTEVIYT